MLAEAVKRARVDPAAIQDIAVGNVLADQAGPLVSSHGHV